MAKIQGIDISQWQGNIDFKKVANSNVKFIILREGYRKGIDKKFLEYAKECKKHDIPIMVYHFIYTDNATIKQNALATYNNIKRAGLDPSKIWIASDLQYDTWEKNHEQCTKEKCTQYTLEYLNELKKLGCNKLFIYCNNDYYKNYYNWDILYEYPVWVADLSGLNEQAFKDRFPHAILHQYNWTGNIPGINGEVDMDYLYNEDMLKENKIIKFSKIQQKTNKITAQDVIQVMQSWVGMSRANGTHKPIIDTYNSYNPKARGYTVTYTDEYCDTTISAAFIKLNAVNLIGGTECGVEKHVAIFKKYGIWQEDGTVVPQPGDLIVFNWDQNTQPNDGYSDHIGIVEKVIDNKITTIEGNMTGGIVGRRTIPVGWPYIRGYAKPKYAQQNTNTTPVTIGNVSSSTQKNNQTVQIDYATSFDKKLIRAFTTTANLNIRAGASLGKTILGIIPKGETVQCYGYYTNNWYYIQYKNISGFCSKDYLR